MIVIAEHPRGLDGVREGVREMSERMDRGRNDPWVIKWTRRVLQEKDALSPRGRPDPTKIVLTLFEAIKAKVGFVRDPVDTELMIGARELLCLDPEGMCIPAGDCDDQVILLGATALSAGVPIQLRTRFYKSQKLAHVVMLYDRDPRLSGQWTCIDPSLDSGACSTLPFESELIEEVHMGKAAGGDFIGIGDPPPAQLGAAESAVWTQRVANERDVLDRSRANLRAKRDGLTKVRAALGYPDVDPPAGGGDVQRSPIAQYSDTLRYTAAARDAESRLLSAADFAIQMLDDGLAGRRPMYFQDADIQIGALQGDPYFILMRKNADGHMVPSFVDPKTNETTGQIGEPATFLIVAGVVVVVALAVSAAVNLDKIIDFIAQRHHDDMLLKMADYQQNLINSGKATPEQLAALQKANANMAAASQLQGKGGLSWPLLLLSIGLAAVGGFVLARYGTPAIRHYDTRIKRRIEKRYSDDEASEATRGGAARAFAF